MLRKIRVTFSEVAIVALWCLILAVLQVILALWIPLGLRQGIVNPLAVIFWLSMGLATFGLYAGFQQVHKHWSLLVASLKEFKR